MDFTDSPEEADYRARARAWLTENAPKFARAGKGSDELGSGEEDADDMTRAKAWQARKAEAGYAQITWPKEWGGGGGTPIQSVIFGEEEAKFDVAAGYFQIGLGMCVPTVMAFAGDEVKQRFVGPALRGEEIWCQLFSEPGGGLARLPGLGAGHVGQTLFVADRAGAAILAREPGRVLAEPGASLGAKIGLFGAVGEVHGSDPCLKFVRDKRRRRIAEPFSLLREKVARRAGSGVAQALPTV